MFCKIYNYNSPPPIGQPTGVADPLAGAGARMDADLLRHPPGGHCEDGGTDDLGWGSIRCRRSRGTRVGGQLWLRQRVYVWEYASDGELIMPRTNFGICGSEGGGAVRSGWTMSSDMLEWLRGGDWGGIESGRCGVYLYTVTACITLRWHIFTGRFVCVFTVLYILLV